MGKNLDIAVQLFKKGTVLLIPAVRFPGADQILKCKFISYLPQEILEDVDEANSFAEFYLSKIQKRL